ncbi:MAG: hypothetical protein J07AB43_02460 [Candidatus Nanosalina sp. J07AB43]|jgi:hypothetical protein|nr:MAG: hypothetical protein J07AB43_02460 [Candidatus Nanosalina sp. J07AB43]
MAPSTSYLPEVEPVNTKRGNTSTMANLDTFLEGPSSEDDNEEQKYRVYTRTMSDMPGHVTVEATSTAQAEQLALDCRRHTEVVSVEEHKRGSINHPDHEW